MTRREWLALTSCATACAPHKNESGAVTVRVGLVQSSSSTGPLQLALEKGYLREQGLQLEANYAQVTGLHIAALAAGKLDAALISMSPAVANGVAQGAPIRLVATRQSATRVCGGWGQLFGRLDAFPGGLKDFRELRGKRIAFSAPGSQTDFTLDIVLDSAGLTRADVKAIAIKRQESIAALLNGNIDAIMQAAGTKDIPADRRAGFGYFPGAEVVHPKLQTLFVAFGERLRGGERDAGLRFLRVMRRAGEEFFGYKHPEFMRKWSREMGDPDMPIANCPYEVANNGAVDPASIKIYLDWALRRKHIEVPVAPEALIDATLVRDLGGPSGV